MCKVYIGFFMLALVLVMLATCAYLVIITVRSLSKPSPLGIEAKKSRKR